MNKELKEHTIRFLDVINRMNITHSYLCENVYHKKPSYLSNVKSGRQDASIEMLVGFTEAYPEVNANYILTGKGSMFISEDGQPMQDENKGLADKIEEMQGHLKEAYEEIGRLNMEIRSLKEKKSRTN